MSVAWRKVILAPVSAFSLAWMLALSSANAQAPKNLAGKEAVACGAMVASSHSLPTQAGLKILKAGGNAFDAAIAVQFALNVVEPMMSGIGGGAFFLAYEAKTRKVFVIDAREFAPKSALPGMFLDEAKKPIPFATRHTSGIAVGVPGTLKGLALLHSKLGSMPWAELLTPALGLSQKGFAAGRTLGRYAALSREKVCSKEAGGVFCPGDSPLEAGGWLVQPVLAKTLETIQRNKDTALYEGEIARAIVEAVQAKGGGMTLEDLKAYKPEVRPPLWGRYRNYRIASVGPPGGGLAVLEALGILESANFKSIPIRSAKKYHLILEALRLAFADRSAFMGDPAFVGVPVRGLLDDNYLAGRHSLIRMDKANDSVHPGKSAHSGETTHFVVADASGNIACVTSTIEQPFGSGIYLKKYGFFLNNELTDFDATPGGPNEPGPYKRPMSAMAPTLVLERGLPVLALGSPGGPTIIVSVLQVLIHRLDYGLGLKDAIEEPRVFTSAYPSFSYEGGVPKEALEKLRALGHAPSPMPTEIGNVQAIACDPKSHRYTGACDSTREGMAAGLSGLGEALPDAKKVSGR